MLHSNKKSVLVTGGGRRVGAVIARTLATAGYRVAIHANRSIDDAAKMVSDLTESGHEAVAVQADLRSEQAVCDCVAEVAHRWGHIDGLVNSAAIWVPTKLENVTADQVREHFEINTLGTFLFCQQVGRVMVEQPKGGAIVNIGDWAIQRPYLNYAAYFVSKGAIPTLTRNLAVELAARNPEVRVNAVLPGPVMLPPDLTPEERRQAVAGTLVKREGSPQNVADAVLFLLQNDFVTGVCLPVDGGRSIA